MDGLAGNGLHRGRWKSHLTKNSKHVIIHAGIECQAFPRRNQACHALLGESRAGGPIPKTFPGTAKYNDLAPGPQRACTPDSRDSRLRALCEVVSLALGFDLRGFDATLVVVTRARRIMRLTAQLP